MAGAGRVGQGRGVGRKGLGMWGMGELRGGVNGGIRGSRG